VNELSTKTGKMREFCPLDGKKAEKDALTTAIGAEWF
jgi:hypothetical protein